jgi:RHS repeat-associated protein
VATDGAGKKTIYLWQGDVPLAVVSGTETQFLLHNHLNSVHGITDAAGKMVERLDYDPFGVPQSRAGRLQPGFAGLCYDGDAGLYLMRSRAYDPDLGRFLSRDPEHRIPAGDAEDLSCYAYCGGDPVNWCDSAGAAKNPGGGGKPSTNGLNNWSGKLIDGQTTAGFGVKTERTHYDVQGQKEGSHRSDGEKTITQWKINNPSNLPQRYTPLQQDLRQVGKTFDTSTPRNLIFQSVTPKKGSSNPNYITPPDLRESRAALALIRKNPDDILLAANKPTKNEPNPRVSFSWDPKTSKMTGTLTSENNAPYSPLPSYLKSLGKTNNVGGIKLRGIGDALKDLGPLKGVAVDANGRLVLLTADKGEVDLPPLSIDDVVVIFRAAYRTGEAPHVSIDPDKKDPHAATMDIRHSPGTENTYVGWVLFEADRVMKAYSLGEDNETKEKIQSRIDGYASTVSRAFGDPPREKGDELWARFWIVPAEVTRRQSSRDRLTLLDVPLKVDTEVVVPKNGMLESVPGAKSNPSDEAFARWFSEHYADLAREVWSTPPPESGRKDKVRIFAELQRIALIAAIAEQLRDQQVPLPGWMRDHQVEPFKMPRTTKTHTVKEMRTQGDVNLTRSVFGGAVMSPPASAIKTVRSPEADALAPVVYKAVSSAPALTPVRFEHQGESYRAVALPGDDTLELGANQLEETDLSLRFLTGEEVSLVRRFDSFHQPADVLGAAWTFDLPQLDVQHRRRHGEGKQFFIDNVYQMTSPLGTWTEFFADLKEVNVPGVFKGRIAAPRTTGDMLGVWTNKVDQHILLFRDGRRWTFDKDGWLIEQRAAALTLVFQRDSQHRVTRIEGRVGPERRHIDLRYDESGRLTGAADSDGKKVTYTYDSEGQLTDVRRADTVLEYRYRGKLVAEEHRDGKVQREFDYDERGGLRGKSGADEEKVTYQTTRVPEGTRVTHISVSHPDRVDTYTYDARLRPLAAVSADGTRAEWQYEGSGAITFTVTAPGAKPLTVKLSADRRREETQLPSGAQYVRQFDEQGRETDLIRDGQTLHHVEWSFNGQPSLIQEAGQAYRLEYRENGVAKRALITSPGKQDQYLDWIEVLYDERGVPVTVKESAGTSATLDAQGEMVEMTLDREGKSKVKCERDDKNRVLALQTTWGYRELYRYLPEGGPDRIELADGENKAQIEFRDGRLSRVQHFDGGEVRLTYHDDGERKGLLRGLNLPDGPQLNYTYDARGRLAEVACGRAYRWVYEWDENGRLLGFKQVRASPGAGQP